MKVTTQYLGKVSITCNGLWDINRQYDRLCLIHDGHFASYISRKFTPAGIPLTNEEYWQPVASLRDDVKASFDEFTKKIIELLAQIQLKLKSARIVVADMEERDSLTINDIAPGCEVYVLETQLTWILDSIICSSDNTNNIKTWHLEADGRIDSEEKYELEGTFDTLTADRAICDAYGNIIHDTYITRQTIHEYVDKIIHDFIDEWRYEIPDGSITYDDLSEQLKQLLAATGTAITNFPDEEDITVNTTNQLKFKDRHYEADGFGGMGYKVLRKNWMNNINLLEQNMINEPNTIYEVRYLFCLDGTTITMPENSVLLFKGGQFNNGTLNLTKTRLVNISADNEFGTAQSNWDCATGQIIWFTGESALKVYNGTEWKTITLN